MGKKKVKASAFSVYMHEFIAKERHPDQKRTMEQWAAIVTPYYEKLTAEQKEAYKQKAKTQPARTVVVPPKYTSQGISLDLVDREARELAEKQKYMERKVKSIVEVGFLENDINTRTFVFIMANYFYKTDNGIYKPAEIAAVKFNFKDAILKSYHTYVNPGKMDLGFAREANEHSDKTHRLPPPPSSDAMGEKEEDYDRVYAGILDVLDVRVGQTFSKDDPKRPCVFTRKQDVEMIESILDQLSNGQWRQTFDVFHLELLFNQLKNKVESNDGRETVPISVTNVFIEQDRYDTTPNISCDFHEKKEAERHCALSYVKRWFYLFADHICVKIGVKLEAGRHLPSNAALEPPPRFEDDNIKNEGRFADVAAGSGLGGGGQNLAKKDSYDDGSMVSSDHSGYPKFHNESDSSEPDDY